MSVLVMATAAVVVAVVVMMLVMVVVAAVAVDTHDDSVDTVDWFRVCVENV
jgi:hypothetical protein